MTVRYFPTFLVCIALSVSAVTAGLFAPGAFRFALTGAALLPLFYYHLVFLAPRVRGADDSASIDSVYYYGFLITVAALGAAALSVNLSGVVDFQPVLVKFGVGVIATGYAVAARMHLVSRAQASSGPTGDDAVHQYVRRSQALVDDIETAIVRVREFSDVVLRESREVQTRTQVTLEAHLLESARAFRDELATVLPTSRAVVEEIRDLVGTVALEAERAELRKLLNQTATTARKLDKSMEGFAATFDDANEHIGRFNEHARGLTDAAREATESLGSVGEAADAMAQANRALADVAGVAGEAAASARNTLGEVSTLAASLTRSSEALEGMQAFTVASTAQFANLTQSAERLNEVLKQFGLAGQSAEGFQRDLDGIASTFRGLSREVGTTVATLEALQSSVAASTGELEADVKRSVEATKSLIDGLAGIADEIIRATQARRAVS